MRQPYLDEHISFRSVNKISEKKKLWVNLSHLKSVSVKKQKYKYFLIDKQIKKIFIINRKEMKNTFRKYILLIRKKNSPGDINIIKICSTKVISILKYFSFRRFF